MSIRPPGYRLPDSTRLGGVSLLVSDLGRSIAYYEEVLGLTCTARSTWTAELSPGKSPTPLLILRSQQDVVRHPTPRLGLFHFALLVPTREALGRFLGHLVERRMPVASADHAVSEALYLNDPDGLGIEVYADRPRAEWRQQGSELYLTTEPLDSDDLLQAAGGHGFDGLDAGTVLGHMHLRVGTLDAAEAFYHRALGFDKIVWSYPGALFLSAGGYHHHLGTNTWGGRLSPRTAREPGVLSWDIVLPSVSDVGDAVRSCLEAGTGAVEKDDGWAIADPWGTELRLVEDRS